MQVLITLTSAAGNTGPTFDLYSDADGYVTAFETGVAKSSLLAGYTSNVVPNAATVIRCKSVGTCTNYVDFPISGLPVPPSPTPTITPTASPVPPSNLELIFSFSPDPGMGGSCTLFQSSDGVNYTTVNSFSSSNSVSINPTPDYYYYITTYKTSGGGTSKYAQSVWNVDSVGGVNAAGSAANGTSVDSDVIQIASGGTHTYELRGYITNLL